MEMLQKDAGALLSGYCKKTGNSLSRAPRFLILQQTKTVLAALPYVAGVCPVIAAVLPVIRALGVRLCPRKALDCSALPVLFPLSVPRLDPRSSHEAFNCSTSSTSFGCVFDGSGVGDFRFVVFGRTQF